MKLNPNTVCSSILSQEKVEDGFGVKALPQHSPLKACVTCESPVFTQRTPILSAALMHIFYMQKTHTKRVGKKRKHFILFFPLYFILSIRVRDKWMRGKTGLLSIPHCKKGKDEAWMKNHLCKIKSRLQMYFKRAATLRC